MTYNEEGRFGKLNTHNVMMEGKIEEYGQGFNNSLPISRADEEPDAYYSSQRKEVADMITRIPEVTRLIHDHLMKIYGS